MEKETHSINDPRRRCVCSFKASEWQRQEVKRLAEACGENLSTYVLMRALNYQPKLRLTPGEAAALENLRDCRRDVRRFFNALEGCSPQERKAIFSQHGFMVEWAKNLMHVADRIKAFLDRVEAPNQTPQAWTKP